MIKNYKFWYSLITAGILVVLFYGYLDFASCALEYSSEQITGPNFCGIIQVVVFTLIISFWLSMTFLLILREIYKKKGKIKFYGYKFWLYSVILSVILIILFVLITTSSGGLVNMLRR